MMYNDSSKNDFFLESPKPTFFQKFCSLFICWHFYKKGCNCGYFYCSKLCNKSVGIKNPILDDNIIEI